MEDNPFSALLSGGAEISSSKPTNVLPGIDSVISNNVNSEEDRKSSLINAIVEDVFYITINNDETRLISSNKSKSRQLVFLQEYSTASAPKYKIDLDILEQALFDRLLLANPKRFVIPREQNSYDKDVIENEVLLYLYSSAHNLTKYSNSNNSEEVNVANSIRELILRNAVTALSQPELFNDQMLYDQLFTILKNHSDDCHVFINDVINAFMSEDSPDVEQLKSVIVPLLKKIQKDVFDASLVSLDNYVFPAMFLFSTNVHLATFLIEFCKCPDGCLGRVYQETLLGGLLSLSVLPKSTMYKPDYFDTPLDRTANNILEGTLWSSTDTLLNNLHKIFLNLLKLGPSVKNGLLEWIACCLHSNASRGKLWNIQGANSKNASDAFMLNLSYVLLMLCQPFCSSPKNLKCLKIDPTYCAVEENETQRKGVHLKEMTKETCIIPPREVYEDVSGPTRETAESYNFLTECFFMTHKALDLGYRIIVEKLIKTSQELNNTREYLADDPNSEMSAYINMRMKASMILLQSMKCVLREPQSISLLANLHAATCNWLVQLAIHGNSKKDNSTFAPLVMKELKFPLTDEEPESLRCVPEFLIGNVIEFMSAMRLLKPLTTVDQSAELLEPILSLVLVFMGDSKKMRNPHLRARLAECLSTLLPIHDSTDDEPISSITTFVREKLFKEHPHRLQIVPSLLHVFVGIEVTGESVQFEQKFHYRRPMYIIMDYLWQMQEHRDCFRKLSLEAEANMEAVNPPIFLRFINLLMNDAVFLLDESLSNMAQLRTMQTAMNNQERPAEEGQEQAMNYRHVGMIARFDNILGKHTINTLERLTSKIKSIFCHPTMVDRIAAMLNYFLLHLVGPNRKNLKVKDSKEYDFDPVSTVLNICRIYIHLGENEDFCLAVSNDGRSYGPQLFELAENVLAKIQGGGELILSLREVAASVARLAARRLEDEEIFADAPDEFLDPIMSTMMIDPVLLPSSKITIDRTTIARHLLSDQSDPFNRSPLTMDQVRPNDELRLKIQQWIKEKRSAAAASNN